MDREKVISQVEEEVRLGKHWDESDRTIDMELLENVLLLLKEQETEDTGRCRIFQCKKCGFGIDDIFVNDEEKYQIVPRYCPNCGRSVKWDD